MTYEYLCKACGATWETEQKITEPPMQDCPKCGKPEAQRLISKGQGFQLRGSGWASDGYHKS